MGKEEENKCFIKKQKVEKPAEGRMAALKWCAETCDYRNSCWSIPASPSCINREKVLDIIHMYEVKYW